MLYAEGHGRSDLDAEVALQLMAEAVLQVHQPAEAEQSFDVLVAVECAEHAGEVVGRGNLRAEAAAERFAVGAAAEVVVTLRPSRLRDELEPADAGLQLDNRILE